MDTSPLGLVRSVIPRIPHAVYTSFKAFLGTLSGGLLFEDNPQDLITQLAVIFIRPVLGTPASILESQRQLNYDWGIYGKMWISKITIPEPEDFFFEDGPIMGVKQAVLAAIKELGSNQFDPCGCGLADVEAEWTAHRSGVSYVKKRENIAESEHYGKMMRDVGDEGPVILYTHGGAACLMDPITHRLTTSSLAKHAKARVLSVRFRLAPQNPFPAALIDAFVAYLSLLSPPPGAFHDPIPPTSVVLAGDSSGAGLAASLLLLLLTLRTLHITHIRFHGRDVDISGIPASTNNTRYPPVAGLALTSPWLDVSRSLPSVHTNSNWDIIAPPSTVYSVPCPAFPPDAIWPTNPPRVETYCPAHMVIHPLVSPLAAKKELWRGAPPVYICVGWESMQDEAEVFGRKVFESGGSVVFDGYVGMPHCFGMVPWNWMGRQAMRNWGRFCGDVVNGKVDRVGVGSWTRKDGCVAKVELGSLGMQHGLSDDRVEELLAEQKERRVVLEKAMLKEWEAANGRI
ncbi:hypothetical protein EJ08DRAFT_598345 [Tothia fuscella]|uniref:Alpha/beta hydrolase fold-3 domain-containing protein n=1 Tax=Tothia fuscella TaxID=1048955 RepID=A0A9P4NG81_9PEZI|nr:hypothetical protein EJ08DRAFT_598345 [Tothia fuscella]